MTSIGEILDYIKETKSLIKNAIITKGVAVSDSDTFRSYEQKIDDIPTGGSAITVDHEYQAASKTHSFNMTGYDQALVALCGSDSSAHPMSYFGTITFDGCTGTEMGAFMNATARIYGKWYLITDVTSESNVVTITNTSNSPKTVIFKLKEADE